MGLDMYLNRTNRIAGFKPKDYARVNNVVSEVKIKDFKTLKGLKGLNRGNKDYSLLDKAVREVGSFFKWLSIFEQVGYWRKANHIHVWLVQNCQRGVDECQLSNEVTKAKLEKLLEVCNKVMGLKVAIGVDDDTDAKFQLAELLPTASGFFFGGTDYDEWYFKDVEDTIKIINDVLDTTDFEKQIIFYRSSW